MALGYSRRPVADEAAYQHKLEKTREYLTPEMSVFEFGCGTGTTGIHHAPYVKSVRAIDVSKNMIDIARGKAASTTSPTCSSKLQASKSRAFETTNTTS